MFSSLGILTVQNTLYKTAITTLHFYCLTNGTASNSAANNSGNQNTENLLPVKSEPMNTDHSTDTVSIQDSNKDKGIVYYINYKHALPSLDSLLHGHAGSLTTNTIQRS